MAVSFDGLIRGEEGEVIEVTGSWTLIQNPGGRDDWRGTIQSVDNNFIDAGSYELVTTDGKRGAILVRNAGHEVEFGGDGVPPR